MKHCPICTQDLSVDDFGICRARKDGRNLYCKSCIREKVTASRRALKEYKAVQKKRIAENAGVEIETEPIQSRVWMLSKSPTEKVYEAIKRGKRTQIEIRFETKLSIDEIGDALANLLLWTHEIKSKVVDGERIYLLNLVEQKPSYPQGSSLVDLARKSFGPTIKGERRIQRVA